MTVGEKPECCTTYADHVFVYGANTMGRHGAGAAAHAKEHHGAEYGKIGRCGMSYGIPTKDGRDMRTLPLEMIASFVAGFLNYARRRPEERFYVTRIGCGLAGLADEQIAPMFAGAPENCVLPEGWR